MIKTFYVIASIVIISFFFTYYDVVNQKKEKSLQDAEIIESILDISFDESEKVLATIGNEISINNPSLDLEEIHKIFLKTSQIKSDINTFPWTMFDWVDVDGYQKVNTVIGVRKNPPQIARYRNYRNPANSMWKIIFSEPAIGEPSKLYVIPIGVQISTPLYPQAGTITSSINVQKLFNIINQRIDKGTRFTVIDKRSQAVVMSSKRIDGVKSGAVYFSEYKTTTDDTYVIEKEMDDKYPYLIKVGYSREDFWKTVKRNSIKIISQILITVIAVILLSKKSIFSKAKKEPSSRKKRNF